MKYYASGYEGSNSSMSGDRVNVKVVERLIRFGKQLPGYDT